MSDKASAEIVTFTIQLAKKLGISVVAEGVETKEQQLVLSNLQCDWFQGYLFSRPVPEGDFEKLLKGQWLSENDSSVTEERRNYFRIAFQYPLEAFMTVSEINEKKINLGNTNVLMENIGPGGLCFVSNIKLPTRSDILLKFEIEIFHEELILYGRIVRCLERDHLYEYGIKIVTDQQQRAHLIKQFNQFQVQLKRDPLLPGHSFVTENILTYFNKL
jgi:hypothetical protein